ncbi:glycoside hydrolase family 13 protein [Lacticigenium naphthae]|uniref:glycoside hydrolase family 13 protein n=1 Tax=Lacticigenium naphthae TaxID=515351 RepID=UPI00040067BF|nr:alpha-glucosidase [Lacticigenium naphthae]
MNGSSLASGEIIYQIYPKSFQDTTQDGMGDLKGIIKRLDYIKKLGVTTIWLNPIFESPQVDNGYDVSDYYTVDSMYGDASDLEELIEKAHERDLKIMFDMVLNHTSEEHMWFQEAIKGKGNPYRDYYLWASEETQTGRPNNWASFLKESAWQKEPNGEDYYFHLFHKEMPDLNWKNPKVREEMYAVAEYWLNKGVDGLRLDAFIHIDKEPGYPSLPYIEPREIAIAEEFCANLPNVKIYLSEFVSKLKENYPGTYIVGEASSALPDLALEYTYPRESKCDSIVSFRYFPEKKVEGDGPSLPLDLMKNQLDHREFKKVMSEWQRVLEPMTEPTLYLNNHDMPRIVSRYGDEDKFRDESSKTFATLMYLQKGVPVILYGEEIGMKNLILETLEETKIGTTPEIREFLFENLINHNYSVEEALKFLEMRNLYASRGAMQWTTEKFSGFSAVRPWSGVNSEKKYTVEEQEEDDNSILNFYRNLLVLKKTDLFTRGTFEMQLSPDNIFAYKREYEGECALVFANLSDQDCYMDVSEYITKQSEVLFENGQVKVSDEILTFSPYASIVWKCNK